MNKLTDREREIAILVAQDMNAKQIAMMLGLSEQTVKAHKSNIRQKLGGGTARVVLWVVRDVFARQWGGEGDTPDRVLEILEGRLV